jgi:hypothetical protein
MRNLRVWIDTRYLLLLKHRVEGTSDDGQAFFVETVNSDFRRVPGTELCEPYKTTMRIGGIMDDEQMAQLAESREQLAEMEAQLRAMPANQREMMENMLGGQMEMLRNMTDDGVLEHTQIVEEIYVNPDLAELFRVNPDGAAGTVVVEAANEGNLVQRIQRDLETLGYDPGEINGELMTETVVAISQFQAERSLTVNGEATEQLAAAIAAEAAEAKRQARVAGSATEREDERQGGECVAVG